MRHSNNYGRIVKASEYKTLYTSGSRFNSTSFNIVYRLRKQNAETSLPNSSYASPSIRIGCVAAKKLGKAVLRNRIKRILRAAVSKAFLSVITTNNLDIIISAKSYVLHRPFITIVKELRYCLNELNKKSV